MLRKPDTGKQPKIERTCSPNKGDLEFMQYIMNSTSFYSTIYSSFCNRYKAPINQLLQVFFCYTLHPLPVFLTYESLSHPQLQQLCNKDFLALSKYSKIKKARLQVLS